MTRLWNATVATGIAERILQYADSVSLCFSKGLGAPVGSIVAGDKAFIQRAHCTGKPTAAEACQGGILAAAALHAIKHQLPKLAEDHRRAKAFAEALHQMSGIHVLPETVETNIVIFEVDPKKIDAADLVRQLQVNGVLMFQFGLTRIRAVMHLHINRRRCGVCTICFSQNTGVILTGF
ncbi:MAG: beta-eliminating lyase-related protein [Calditrichia bacterium]